MKRFLLVPLFVIAAGLTACVEKQPDVVLVPVNQPDPVVVAGPAGEKAIPVVKERKAILACKVIRVILATPATLVCKATRAILVTPAIQVPKEIRVMTAYKANRVLMVAIANKQTIHNSAV